MENSVDCLQLSTRRDSRLEPKLRSHPFSSLAFFYPTHLRIGRQIRLDWSCFLGSSVLAEPSNTKGNR